MKKVGERIKMIDIKYKLIDVRCEPVRSEAGAAAYDLRAYHPHFIYPESSKIIELGVCFMIPIGYCGILTHRSSMAFKKDSVMSYGLIDSSFCSEVKALFFNHGTSCVRIEAGDRIAQIRFTKVDPVTLTEGAWRVGDEDNFKEGFGSSGV